MRRRPGGPALSWLPAVPDAVTAPAFACVWAWPMWFGIGAVKTAMLTMLVEFFLVHATGFYLMFIGIIAASFGEWWPLLAFGWLIFGKLPALAGHPGDDAETRERRTFHGMAAWAGMVAAYLGGCMLTLFLPIPTLGIEPHLVTQFGLDPTSEGVWESEPHRVVAFGVVYFSLLAIGKLVASGIMSRRTRVGA